MAKLTPNTTYYINGVLVNEKIIPDGTRWQDATKSVKAGFPFDALYKKQKKLSNGTGKVKSVTIHNTSDLIGVYDDAEQYTRATYNENMGSARVHFYVDDTGAWQNLKAGTGMCSADPEGSAEVSWHSGDGSIADGGNSTSLSMEIIMAESATTDAKAKDNGARIAAWLLWKHGLNVSNLVTHTYWVNKSLGNIYDDVDQQCCHPVANAKWCPAYIFNSNVEATALKNWKAFKKTVQTYLDALNKESVTETIATIEVTYKVRIGSYKTKDEATSTLTNVKGKGINGFVVEDGGKYSVQIGSYKRESFAEKAVEKAKSAGFAAVIVTEGATAPVKKTFEPYVVKVTATVLNIRNNPGTDQSIVSAIYDHGCYTIVEEADGKGATKWGKLKSGAGWISLDYTTRV